MVMAPPRRNVEVVIGRLAAACVHPYAAWRVRSRSTRLAVVAAYAVMSYIAMLAVLLTK